jgi:replicative DNA helicase
MSDNLNITPQGNGIIPFSVNDMLEQLELFKHGQNECLARTGFDALDAVISGYVKDEVTVIAARPGMGASAFMINQLLSVGDFQKVPAAFFSLQLSKHLVMERLVSILTGKYFYLGSVKKYTEEEIARIMKVMADISTSPLYFFDSPQCMITDLTDEMQKLYDEKGVKVFFIDYLQLIRSSLKKGTLRDEELGYVMNKLKAFAKQNRVSVVLNSTLSRAVETRGGDKRPMLSDLRESGAIELVADKVLFIYRPSYYNITEDERGNSLLGRAEIIVSKNLRGPMDTINLHFDPFSVNFRSEIDLNKIDFNEMINPF